MEDEAFDENNKEQIEEGDGDPDTTINNTTPNNNNNGPSVDGRWRWSTFFEKITADARGSMAKNDPSLPKASEANLKNWGPLKFFNYFMPWNFSISIL